MTISARTASEMPDASQLLLDDESVYLHTGFWGAVAVSDRPNRNGGRMSPSSGLRGLPLHLHKKRETSATMAEVDV